jgi:hypothetical protein
MGENKLEKIKLEDIGLIEFDGLQIKKDAYVDINAKVERPPIAISIGEITQGQKTYECEFGTYGNFSCIHGASKSKKTFLKSLLIATYIGGNSNQYAPNIKSHRKNDKYILDFDTEQSKYHAHKVFKRAIRLVGGNYKNYVPFYLRRYDWNIRLQFIEWIMNQPPYKGNIGLVNIDGYADLVKDINDLESCNALVQKIMTLSDVHNCHITGILHSNYGTEKPTGHLGSAILKKSETICRLEVDKLDKTITNVTFDYTRGLPIDNFSFKIDTLGLPIVIDNEEIF